MAAKATARNVSSQVQALYTASKVADDRFSAALKAKYGARAGDMRYQTSKLPPDLKKLAYAHQDASQKYLDAMQRERKNSALSDAKGKAKLVLTMATPGGVLLGRKSGKAKKNSPKARLALTLEGLRKNPPVMSVTHGTRRADIYPHKGGGFVSIIPGQKPEGPFSTAATAAKAARLRLAENPSPFKTIGRAAKKLVDKLRGKLGRNPQDAVEDMYLMFHGLPSTEIVEFRERIHKHEWLWAAGTLVSLEVKGRNGAVMTLAAPDPDKVPFEHVVMVALSEDGRQVYFRGGDQSLQLDQVLRPLGMNDDDVRDNMLIGDIKKITYRTFKNFENGGKTPINFWHPTGKEHADGVLPKLCYHPLDPSMFVVGGRIKVAPKSLGLGASPGIVG